MSLSLGIRIRDSAVVSWVQDSGDQTLSLDHDLISSSLVIDLGGYTGDWSRKIYSKYKCKIEIYEPFNNFAEQIKEKFQDASSDVKVFNFAIGGGNYTASLFEYDLSTKILENKEGNIKVIDIFDTLGNRNIDLLKINIEGSEYEVFDSIFRNKIAKNIESLLVQFHPIDNDSINKYEQIFLELSKTHECVFRYPFIWEKWILKK
jgi:FkbM family methyltransferase